MPSKPAAAPAQATTPSLLGDKLVRLAQDADAAGFGIAAEHLAFLASQMVSQPDALRGSAV